MIKKSPSNQPKVLNTAVREKPSGFSQFLRDRNPHLFSHHPADPAFQDHVWLFRGLYFCKGCTVTFAGMIFGGFLYWLTGWLKQFSDIQIGFIFLGLLLPTLATTLLGFSRGAKHMARFLLGILMASALVMLFVTHSMAVRGAIVCTYLAVKIPLERKRKHDNEALMVQQPRRRRTR